MTTSSNSHLGNLSRLSTTEMPRYKAYFPITRKMSPFEVVVQDSAIETKEQEALWHYNRAREYEGLYPLRCLPNTVRFRLLP